MTEETTTDETDEIEQPEMNLDEIDQQITQLHDSLDNIKASGHQLASHLRENATTVDDPERLQSLISRAGLLYDRVENGDRNLVRGE